MPVKVTIAQSLVNRAGFLPWVLLWLLSLSLPTHAAVPSVAEVARACADGNESIWRSCAEPSAKLSSRTLFAYALVLCEARQHPERLERLFELAAQMQDRNPQSRTYGNFHWYWSDERVLDANAVDFCMRAGPLLWSRFREQMPPAARRRLKELLDFSVHGLLGHKVAESYSNIALMNAGDLILLGEAFGRPDVADEGYARLDRICLYTWDAGIHEFVSPTYTGVDLDGLVAIEAFCQRERGRAQARALLELFWTDIALNWFPPAEKVAGAQSRTYDYLYGLGSVDTHLILNGWLIKPLPKDIDTIFGANARWHPPQNLREYSGRFPRLVRQSWGRESYQSRTHYVLPNITLSSIGAAYGGRMDMPLTADLPGDRHSVRCYFIADGRDDPYGRKKIPAGAHQKAFHLDPFWTAAQRNADALGLAIYRDKDIPTNAVTLVSNFVMPLHADSFWIGGQPVTFEKGRPHRATIKPGEVVTLRKGAAALGIRVLWSRGLDAREASTALVFDANEFGALRFAVEHVPAGVTPAPAKLNAGAAFWVRIGSDLISDSAFGEWRRRFAAATAEVEASADRVRLRVAGLNGPVTVGAAAPWTAPESLEPLPSRAVLELNGNDVGREILRDIEPIKSHVAAMARAVVEVPADSKGIYWEAESGVTTPLMTVGDDPAASGGKFVWMPGTPGERGARASGSVAWRLRVAPAGNYCVWGRVLTPTPQDDSFFVHASIGLKVLFEQSAWPTGVHAKWEWVRVSLEGGKEPAAFAFPAGEARFEIRVREDGAKIDRLFISSNLDAKPEP